MTRYPQRRLAVGKLTKRRTASRLTVIHLRRKKRLPPKRSNPFGNLKSGLKRKRKADPNPDLPRRPTVNCTYRSDGGWVKTPLQKYNVTAVHLDKSRGSSMKVLQDCFSQSLVKNSFHSVWATRQLAYKMMATILILDSTSWVMVLFKLAYSLGHGVYPRTQRVLARTRLLSTKYRLDS